MSELKNNLKNFFRDILKSNEMLAEIFLKYPNVTVVLDENFNIVAVNEKCCEIFCKPNDSILNKNWINDCVEHDYKPEVESLLKDSLKLFQEQGFFENYLEFDIISNTGIKKYAWNITVVTNSDKKNYIVLTGEDISLKQIIEKGYLSSELKFRSLFESTSETVFNTNVDWSFVDLNNAGCSLFKLNVENIGTTKLTDFFINSHDKEFFIKILNKHKFIKDYEIYLNDYLGQDLYVIINCNVIENEEGEITGYQGIIRDYTERYKNEAKLRLLQKAVDCSKGIVMITDFDGNIEHVNPHFEKITGYSEEEVIGQNPRILTSGEHDNEFFKNFWMTINKGNSWDGEFINKKKNGDIFIFKCNVSPVFSKDGTITHFVSVGTDITNEKTLEKQVQQAAKMETIGRLVGGVAHDFNNLLTIINGYAEMLIDFSNDESIKSDLQEVKNAGERAAALTRQLLAFSRQKISKPKKVDVNEIFKDLEKMLRRLVGESIKCEFKIPEEKLFLKIDPSQLEQIIMNLVVNARDAMKKGGELTLTLDSKYIDNSKLEFGKDFINGEYVIISVEDTGTGIPNEILDKIFDPFFTTKREGEGTGLGLSTVYGIVKQNNGSINIESEVGVGTKFTIYLLKYNESLEDENEEAINYKNAFKDKKVLIVEDEKNVRQVAEIIFRDLGFKVETCEDIDKFPDFFNSLKSDLDLIFCDLILPNITGDKLIENLKISNKIKCLYTSGYPEEYLIDSGVKLDNIDIIHKPYTKEELYIKLIEILNK